MSCGGNCHNSNYVNGILNRCKISNGGKNLVNNFNQRISNLENGELDLTNVSTDIIPSENEAFDLGSNEKRFKDLYLSGNTINLGGLKLSDNNGELGVTNENGEDVLNKSTKLWAQLGEDIDGEASGDSSGTSVSLSGDGTRVAIGAPYNDNYSGHTRVYEWNGSNWTQLGEDIDGEASGDVSGNSVSLSADGSIVAIGEIGGSDSSFTGQVRVFQWDGNNWNQLGQKLLGFLEFDHFGLSVSLSADGTRVAISAPYNNGIGQVRVYEFDGSNWTQLGQDIDGKAFDDQSGRSLSLSNDGTRVAIGAPYYDGNEEDSYDNRGHVRVYEYSNENNWTQLGDDIIGEASGDSSGWSVSLCSDGTRVAIGAPYNDNYSGHTRVYEWNGSNWTQLGEDIDGEASGDQSGISVSLSADGTRVAIGAPYNDASGQVRVYEFDGSNWTQLGQDIDGEAAYNDSGYSVSLSDDGTRVAIGAPYNDDNGNNSGQVSVFQLSNYNYNEIENLYVSNELKFKENNKIKSINDKANLESPVFTGSPEVPTQPVENNNKIVNNTMLMESVNNINGSTISNSSISDTTLKGNINYEDSEGNKNPMLFLNINEENGENTEIIVSKNSSGIYENTSNSIITLRLSDTDITLDLQSNSSILIYTSSSKIYSIASI